MLVSSAIGVACSAAPIPMEPLTAETRSDLEALGKIRVFFAHHSVGGNVLDGMKALASEAGVKLNFVELGDQVPTSTPAAGPAFMEGDGGTNKHPDTKFDYFVTTMGRLADRPPQLALMKLCFVDFNPTADPDKMFADYQATVAAVRKAQPGVTLVHATAPLTHRVTTLKGRLNRLRGKLVWEDATNVKRMIYNEHIRSTYKDEPIFDIARVESTFPNGERAVYEYEGHPFEALIVGYSKDDGHLNDVGARRGAVHLAHVLVQATVGKAAARPPEVSAAVGAAARNAPSNP